MKGIYKDSEAVFTGGKNNRDLVVFLSQNDNLCFQATVYLGPADHKRVTMYIPKDDATDVQDIKDLHDLLGAWLERRKQ